jgi:hypothetical protein
MSVYCGQSSTTQNNLKANHFVLVYHGIIFYIMVSYFPICRNLVKGGEIPASLRAVLKARLQNEYDLYEHIKQKLFRQHAEVEAVRAAQIISNMEI